MLKNCERWFSLVYGSESEQDAESLYIVHVLVPKTNPSKGVSDVAEKSWFLILLALHRDDSVSNLCTMKWSKNPGGIVQLDLSWTLKLV